MLLNIMKYIRGYVRIRVEGYSPERFMNLCNVNHILIWNVETRDQIYELNTGIKDYKKMRPFAKKTRTRITILKKYGFPFFLHRFRNRKLFFAGMFLCCAMIYGMSLFVWNIHFEGNVSQTNEELLDCLNGLGVTHGTWKKDVTCEAIEKEFRSSYPNMLWVSAEMRGTRIMIHIKENEDEDIVSKIEIKDTMPVSIVAEEDGVVESILVRKGTPLVTSGEEVVKGQILVAGYYEIKNDAGEITRYQGVAADADVFLLTEETYHDSYSKSYEYKNYTGKKRAGIKLTFFEKTFDLTPQIKFQNHEIVSDFIQIHITENFYLPFSVEFFWYLEYEPETRMYTPEELKTIGNDRFLNKYKNILQKGVQIIEKNVKIDENDTLCIVGGYVTLRVPVTTKVPVIIPEGSVKPSVEGEH